MKLSMINKVLLPFYKGLGKNMKATRLNLGLSQKKIAIRANNMDKSKISDMENGKEDFTFKTFLYVCSALEIAPTDLLRIELEEE